MTNTYEKVVEAAKRLVTDDSRDTWVLADAIVAEIPNGGPGGRPTKGETSPPEGGGFASTDVLLADLADRMKADGVTTPAGEPYSAGGLSNLREQAITWKADQRHPEAAYRTHREAGGPGGAGGKVLAALAAVARGESARKPVGIDPDAWAKACARIAARRKGWPVAANDVRVALQRKPNVPGPSRPITPDDVREALDSGELKPDDLTDLLSEDELDDAWMGKRRDSKAKDLRERFDSDEDYEDHVAEVGALGDVVAGMGAALDDMLAEFGGGPVAKAWSAAETMTITAVHLLRRHGYYSDYEHMAVAKNVARIREALAVYDLIEAGGGDVDKAAASIAEDAEDFLRTLGSD